MSKDFAIKLCLHRINDIVSKGNAVLVNRQKNTQALFDLGIKTNEVLNCLCHLKVEDYISGPEKDHDGSYGQVWKFLHPLTGCMVYVKIKIYCISGIDRLKIISFHPQE